MWTHLNRISRDLSFPSSTPSSSTGTFEDLWTYVWSVVADYFLCPPENCFTPVSAKKGTSGPWGYRNRCQGVDGALGGRTRPQGKIASARDPVTPAGHWADSFFPEVHLRGEGPWRHSEDADVSHGRAILGLSNVPGQARGPRRVDYSELLTGRAGSAPRARGGSPRKLIGLGRESV